MVGSFCNPSSTPHSTILKKESDFDPNELGLCSWEWVAYLRDKLPILVTGLGGTILRKSFKECFEHWFIVVEMVVSKL